MIKKCVWPAAVLCLTACMATIPLRATVTITALTPSVASPQALGTEISWTVTAGDTNPNNLTFQFNAALAGQPLALVSDFNIGTLSSGVWKAQAFKWTTIAGEGTYSVQVIAKDFTSGETAQETASFTFTSRATKGASVHNTQNPLVALFSAPSCAAGSSIRVAFYSGANAPNYTNLVPCNPPTSMNFYIAGMYPSTAYSMYSQVQTGGINTNGSTLKFTTGALPKKLPAPEVFPAFTVNIGPGSQTDTTDSLLLWGFATNVATVATDLSGNIMWYYPYGSNAVVTRVIAGGDMLTLQNGTSWNSTNTQFQMLQEIDLAGNTVRETNTGALSKELLALGAADAGPCPVVTNPPAPVGTSCLNDLSHEAIQYSIGSQQYTALLAHIEKVFPPGTQGSNPAGPPVDILSEMLIVLNSNWQAVWYYESFQQLNLTRAAVLGEKCTNTSCPVNLLLDTIANDWTHGNAIYYEASSGDFLVSLRNQDWAVKVNYSNGAGTGNVLWEMGNESPNFTFDNINNDPWPWFSHQHDVGYASNGAGPLTVFDNGNTRVSPAPLGLGKNCGPNDCDSRGMALTVVEPTVGQPVGTVTPVLSASLGSYGSAEGSVQLLFDGNYLCEVGQPDAVSIEIAPVPDTLTGPQVLNISAKHSAYRAWQMPTLYDPPVWK